MAFNSIAYLAFLAAVTLLFFLAPRQWRRGLLLVASIAFYAAWKPVFVLAPVALAVWIRFMARRMAAPPRQSTRVFWVACGAIVAALVVFKTRSLLAAVAPVGISFYSFEAISYLIDVRQKRLAEPSFVDLLLYLLFWPTIVSGPILRARELLPQLKFDEPLDARLFVSGVDRIVWGLVQKNAIANVLGSWVDAGFAASRSGYSTLDGWTLACAYGLQIYFDFAAYSNMAIGSAQLIGIRLPENFRFPYHASTPPEFWSRWHMSLSRWIRDYLFFRLNAKYRGAAGRLYVSLIAVMALVGLWHGAGWGFLLWGGLHGAYLALYRLYENTVQRRRPELLQARVLKSGWRLATLAGVALAWVPFRAGGLAETGALFQSMLWKLDFSRSLPGAFYTVAAAVAAFCVVEPFLMGWLARADEAAEERGPILAVGRLALRPAAYAAGMFLFLVFGGQPAQFIYFQF
jgi:alginate O-acetyltransferase complex protein AlgI